MGALNLSQFSLHGRGSPLEMPYEHEFTLIVILRANGGFGLLG